MNLWHAFLYGVGKTFGVAHVRRRIETPEEAMSAVKQELGEAVERARGHAVVRPAIDRDAVELLKNDPEEYFRQRPSPRWRDLT